MTTTLRDVLFAPGAGPAEQITTTLAPLVSSVAGALPGAADALREVSGAFDVPLGNLLLDGWERHRAIDQAKRETYGKPGAIRRVTLLKQTRTSSHRLAIKCEVNDVTVLDVPLDLKLRIDFESANVIVTAGEISDLSLGRVQATATLKEGDTVLVERTLADIDLPAMHLTQPETAGLPAAR
jgi:hypothetical protein